MSRELLHLNDISHIADPLDPSCIDEIVFPSEAVETYLRRWVSRSTVTKNLLLYGTPGTGKTRASILLAKARCAEFLDENPIRYVECESGTFDHLLQIQKSEITVFARHNHPSFESVVILDEFDNFKSPQMRQLKNVMERADQTYILLTNNLGGIDAGVRNRCYEIPWAIPNFDRCASRLAAISSKVCGKTLDEETLRQRVFTSAGWRQMLRNIDSLSI